MNLKKSSLILIVMLLMGPIAFYGFSSIAAQPSDDEKVDVSIVFKNSVNDNLLGQMNAEVKFRFQTFPGVSVRMPKIALNYLENNPNIDFWEYNIPVHLYEDTIDWGVDRIDAEKAWGGVEDAVDVSTSYSGSGVKVAVLDTGIDYNHPDLAPIYAGGYDFVNNDDDPLDDHYHGTHCAGTIAAADDEPNALDGSLIGVAPSVSLYSVKVLDDRGSGTSDQVAAGIDWAAANGMNVASLSLGSSSPSDVIRIAGENAYAAGVLLVAASGNDGGAVGYPAAFPEFIAVGATDQTDSIASFSNYGPELEISAPGVDIMSTIPTYFVGRGPFEPTAPYDTLSGTSMATPHVSGVAALIYSADPTLTNVQVRDILTSTAEDLGAAGWDEYFGYGIADAEAAVNAASTGGSGGDTTAPAKVTGLTATVISSSQIDLSWDANTESDLHHYNIYRDGVKLLEITGTSYSDTGLSASTTYTYEVSAVDTSGNEGILSDPVSATTQDSSTPSNIMYVQGIDMWVSKTYGPFQDLSIKVTVVDGDGIALSGVTVTLNLELPTGLIETYTGTTDVNGEVVFIYAKASSGIYTATVTNLELQGYVYDSTQNVETTDSIFI